MPRRAYYLRRDDLLAANDYEGLERLDRDYSWLDFV